MPAGSFTADITAIRKRARQKMEEGPVTSSYGKDPEDVISVLNEVVATEIVCWMRYTRLAPSPPPASTALQVADEFTESTPNRNAGMLMRAAERDQSARRRPRLRLRPRSAKRAHTTYETFADGDLEGMLRDNLTAERIVITTYQEIIRWMGDDDPTTRRLLEDILADEEEHADDLVDLLGA